LLADTREQLEGSLTFRSGRGRGVRALALSNVPQLGVAPAGRFSLKSTFHERVLPVYAAASGSGIVLVHYALRWNCPAQMAQHHHLFGLGIVITIKLAFRLAVMIFLRPGGAIAGRPAHLRASGHARWGNPFLLIPNFAHAARGSAFAKSGFCSSLSELLRRIQPVPLLLASAGTVRPLPGVVQNRRDVGQPRGSGSRWAFLLHR
jgi:hypothetical protein